jgi:4a-hydroxytetrahydrobiopterin dehydratase
MKLKTFWKFEIPSGWEEVRNRLTKKFEFGSFGEAISFVNEVAKIVEMENHHPSIKVDYIIVTISTYTHSTDEVGEKDIKLAEKINKLLNESFKKL